MEEKKYKKIYIQKNVNEMHKLRNPNRNYILKNSRIKTIK